MPHWLIKAALHRAISWLPASHHWNALFQQYVSRSLDLSRPRFEHRLDCCRLHLDHFLEVRPNCVRDFKVAEVGTGWFPVVPVGLFLCGAGEIWTFDIASLVRPSRLRQVLAGF